MVRVAAADGYGRATVARVIEEAEVSRATFYEHFTCRADCFAAAYRVTMERMQSTVCAVMRGSEPLQRPKTAVEALLEVAAADPAAARFILIEGLGEHPDVTSHHERAIAEIDAVIAGYLADQPRSSPQIQIPAIALRAGIAGTITIHVCRAEAASLPSLHDDLIRWIDSYRLPTGVPPLGERGWIDLGRSFLAEPRPHKDKPALLPRGRGALPAAAAAAARRARIIAATARMTAAVGYSELTVSDIVATARVTRGVFYSHFRSKEDAFLAAQTLALQEAVAAVASEFSLPGSWPERVWAAGETFLRFIAQHPDLAYVDFVAANAAGPKAIRRRHENHMAFSLFLEEGYRQRSQTDPLPRVTSEAVGAAIFGLLRRYVIRRRTSDVLSLLPTLAYLALAPFIGPRQALHFIDARLQGDR